MLRILLINILLFYKFQSIIISSFTKKIAKNKVDSKDKKAPRKGASRESIFNYDIEVTEEMDKKREEK